MLNETLNYALITNCHPYNDPKKLFDALKNPVWLNSMHEELRALVQNNTWVLVPRTFDMNIVGNKWIYKTKYKIRWFCGTIARLVA